MTRPFCQNVDACSARKPTTHCRSCAAFRLNADPEFAEKRREAIRKKFEDPAYLEEHRVRTRATNARIMADPEQRAKRVEGGRRSYQEVLCRPDVRARTYSPEANAKRNMTCANTKLAWCPVEYRDEYKRLIRTHLIKAADARRMIEEQIAADLRRYRATGELQRAKRAA